MSQKEKSHSASMEYSDCVEKLNNLQSYAHAFEIQHSGSSLGRLRVPNMIRWASRVGITLDDIDRLNVIHVSGTKGKGSTRAYCESILLQEGFKTGFFSSPHLVEVRERFRVNGVPISRGKFVSYFMDVYNKLEETKEENNNSMPGYFSFLTVMACHVFIKEGIDVAIIEVGIGGQNDSTNLIRQPVVCGVTSLGFDHVSILGDTIEKIAWHKAGIFKTGVPAFTAPQVPEALEILHKRAIEKGCILKVVPNFTSYEKSGEKLKLGIPGHIQKVNASLALQLTRTWLTNHGTTGGVADETERAVPPKTDVPYAQSFPLSKRAIDGLEKCKWAGRNQTIKKNNITYYLDGAHTVESIEQCVDWFQKHSKGEANDIIGKTVKILIFNTTGERDVSKFMEHLMNCGFDGALFCTNIPDSSSISADLIKKTVSDEKQYKKCSQNMEIWRALCKSKQKHLWAPEENKSVIMGDSCTKLGSQDNFENVTKDGSSSEELKRLEVCSSENSASQSEPTKTGKLDHMIQHDSISCKFESQIQNSNTIPESGTFTAKFTCLRDALALAANGKDPNLKGACDVPPLIQDASHLQVLVTGSVHLVGGVLGIISDEFKS